MLIQIYFQRKKKKKPVCFAQNVYRKAKPWCKIVSFCRMFLISWYFITNVVVFYIVYFTFCFSASKLMVVMVVTDSRNPSRNKQSIHTSEYYSIGTSIHYGCYPTINAFPRYWIRTSTSWLNYLSKVLQKSYHTKITVIAVQILSRFLICLVNLLLIALLHENVLLWPLAYRIPRQGSPCMVPNSKGTHFKTAEDIPRPGRGLDFTSSN